MHRSAPQWSFLLGAVLCLGMGCAGSNDGDLLSSAPDGFQGKWSYLVTNAYDASFEECTGDAEMLEGLSFYEANLVMPICVVPAFFDVVQDGDTFNLHETAITCSDGTTGSISGNGTVGGGAIAGVWESETHDGIRSSQPFSGTVVGNSIQILETSWAFEGPISGRCQFSPGLMATVSVD